MDPRIPDKQYFRIGEVAALAQVATSVLRFWETQFTQLRPDKSRSGQRLYARRDVKRVLQIRDLLYERGFTIPGARRALRARGDEASGAPEAASARLQALHRNIRKDVEELLRALEE